MSYYSALVKENEYFNCELYKILKKFASFCFFCYNAADVFFFPLTHRKLIFDQALFTKSSP